MKITKIFVGVFMAAFLIGITIFYLIPKPESELRPIKIEPIVLEEVSAVEVEIRVQPKIFDVESFFDDAEKETNKDFLETGEVSNIEDFKAKSGEVWFGFFSENGQDVLRQTKLKVKAKKSEGLDWKEISVEDKSDPLFLLKNNKRLKAGAVNTLFRGNTWNEDDKSDAEMTTMKEGFNKKFYLNNVEYTLRVEKGFDTEQEPILVLLLETADTTQLIHLISNAGEDDYVGNLFWVGDLDRDGKLDYYMDFWNYEKGYTSSGIFLSSKAKKGNLVKKFDYLMFGGC